jgi:transcriptional regulator with XRE-family HTH domain
MERQLKKNIGKKLHMLRIENHLTQEEMAEKLHLSTSAYCKIEYGETDLTLTRLNKIAQIFRLSPFVLFKIICGDEQGDSFHHVQEEEIFSHKNNNEDLQNLFRSQILIIETLNRRVTELEKKLQM